MYAHVDEISTLDWHDQYLYQLEGLAPAARVMDGRSKVCDLFTKDKVHFLPGQRV